MAKKTNKDFPSCANLVSSEVGARALRIKASCHSDQVLLSAQAYFCSSAHRFQIRPCASYTLSQCIHHPLFSPLVRNWPLFLLLLFGAEFCSRFIFPVSTSCFLFS